VYLLLSLGTAYSPVYYVGPVPPTRAYWGAQTNGVSTGLAFQSVPGSTNQVQVSFVPALLNTSTNNRSVLSSDILVLSLPPFESRYRMDLTDAAGRPVKKTKKGEALGKPYIYHPPSGVRIGNGQPPGFEGFPLKPNESQLLYGTATKAYHVDFLWLSLLDYFKIKRSGRYHFMFQMDVIFWRPEAEELLLQRLITLPPVEADIDLQLPEKPPSLLKMYGVDILGLVLCLAGVVWLLSRRWRNRPANTQP
jgi:hypothetical protein